MCTTPRNETWISGICFAADDFANDHVLFIRANHFLLIFTFWNFWNATCNVDKEESNFRFQFLVIVRSSEVYAAVSATRTLPPPTKQNGKSRSCVAHECGTSLFENSDLWSRDSHAVITSILRCTCNILVYTYNILLCVVWRNCWLVDLEWVGSKKWVWINSFCEGGWQ